MADEPTGNLDEATGAQIIELLFRGHATRWLSQLAKLPGTTAGEDIFQTAGFTEDRIRSVRVPVVGLYDEETTFSATCRYLESHLADCKIDTVQGARHLPPLQNSAEFARLVKKHLRQLSEGRDVKR